MKPPLTSARKKINLIQKMTPRIIVGTCQCTSKEAVEVALWVTPRNNRRKQLAINYWLTEAQDRSHPDLKAFEDSHNKYWRGLLLKMQISIEGNVPNPGTKACQTKYQII